MQSRNGFTLIELLIVVAIIAIIAGVGYPSFQTLTLNNRITTSTNSMLGLLQLARSEAVTRRADITVCASSDQATCTDDTDWEAGALVSQGADVIKVIPSSDGVQIRGANNTITYNPDGTVDSAAAITVCDERGAASSRRISINIIGQASSGVNDACP